METGLNDMRAVYREWQKEEMLTDSQQKMCPGCAAANDL